MYASAIINLIGPVITLIFIFDLEHLFSHASHPT